MTINERIKMVRQSAQLNRNGKMTAEKFGERLGLKRSAISMIETGVNAPSEMLIKSICKEFDVNPEWLRNGNGPMFREASDELRLKAYLDELLKSEPDGIRARFLYAVSKFNDRDWETVEKLAEALVEAQEAEDAERIRRQRLHEELDRQLDAEKNLEEGSSASEVG